MAKLSDHDFGRLSRRLAEILRRADQGILPFEPVMSSSQLILQGRFRAEVNDSSDGDILTVKVNYDLSWEDMIRAGEYDLANLKLSEEVKTFLKDGKRGEEEVEIRLVHFGRHLDSVAAVEELRGSGYRSANVAELLALGAQHPLRQKRYRIASAGSLVKVRGEAGQMITIQLPNVCLTVSSKSGERMMAEYPGAVQWLPDCRFAAVHV